MSRKVVVIGAGINGLVAANYLRRAGVDVLHLEKKDKAGGACTVEWVSFGGKERYSVPTGASVFGMMQDFIFRETGLAKRIQVYRAAHPRMVYFGDETEPLYLFEDATRYRDETHRKWGESGDVVGFADDLERIRQFLLGIYRNAATPTWEVACAQLGEAAAKKWIAGSARGVLEHYFTADRTKIFECMPITESGPVPLDAPFSAFTFGVMSAGSVFDGYWGFVNGGLWKLPLALADINREIGVELVTSCEIEQIEPQTREVRFSRNGRLERETADAIFFATDPVTAVRLIGDPALLRTVESKEYRGSSGKLVLVFREPVRWKNDSGAAEFDSTVRYFYEPTTLAAFEESSRMVRDGLVDFSPCHFQVYVEGAAMRKMGWNEPYDYLSVFFKDLSLGKRGGEMPEVRKAVEARILCRIANPEALVGSVLFTPRDLQETFFFPGGNIDHMELTNGQTFFSRTFSARPNEAFYQFGNWPDVYYCGAGSFPCGSVAGTAGYMAARQWLRMGR